MAQSIEEIQNEIIAAKEAQPALAALNSTSKVSIWRLWTYVFAAASWTQQKKQDMHKAEVLDIIENQSAHRVSWYKEKALAFQMGHALIPDSDQYDNTGLTESEIDAARVVKFADAEEVYDIFGNVKGITIKVARLVAGDLAPLTDVQMAAFMIYWKRVKDAGVNVYGRTSVADKLRTELTIYYDPLVLSSTGERLDGTDSTPVQDSLDNYLKNTLNFNGEFVTLDMVEALKTVEGVVIPHVESIEAKFVDLDFTPIPVRYPPDSGYLRIEPSDLTINWIPYHA